MENYKKFISDLPYPVLNICSKLANNGFEAYLVGGAVRDMLLHRDNGDNIDYDIATNALPDEIKAIFSKAIYYGNFGTMLIHDNNIKVEITPFRDDAPGRKPDYTFGGNIYTDLSRRDFTINSMAIDIINGQLIDPFGGQQDLKKGVIRCTGSTKRIWEDPLRALRAARFQAQLGFSIDPSTLYALKAHASMLEQISKERIRDEIIKIVTADFNFHGLTTLVVTDLMKYIIPELIEGMGMPHFNKPIDVLEHNLLTCKVVRNTLPLRLAALLHDVGKPRVAVLKEKGLVFPNHHIPSARLAKNILERLRFDNKTIQKVVLLIEHHMFFYSPETPISRARLLVSKLGWDNIYDFVDLRIADRIASGFEHAKGKGLKKLISDLEILKKENSDYKIADLNISGHDLITKLDINPGPQIGEILDKLLEKVIENPELNKKDTLLKLAKKLVKDV